nr:hypothetical protein [uncultured Rhodopila sp.]
MAVTALDTHAIVKQLVAAGFTGEQAEAVTGVVRDAQTLAFSELATKADLELGLALVRADLDRGLASVRADLDRGLALVRADLDRGLASVRADTARGLAETKTEILKWMVTTIGVQTVVILGAMVSFIRLLVH